MLDDEWLEWRNLPYRNQAAIVDNILHQRYDIVFIGLREADTQLYILYNRIAQKLRELNLEPNSFFPTCELTVPTVHERCFSCRYSSSIYFLNHTLCEDMKQKIYQHYLDIFDDICQKDRFVANVFINTTLHANRTPLPFECTTKTNYFLRSTGNGIINSSSDLVILLLFVLIGLFFFPIL